jgi:predicted nucleic acid-binding protein
VGDLTLAVQPGPLGDGAFDELMLGLRRRRMVRAGVRRGGEAALAEIGAIALIHDLTVVTRNVEDFPAAGVRVKNPLD